MKIEDLNKKYYDKLATVLYKNPDFNKLMSFREERNALQRELSEIKERDGAADLTGEEAVANIKRKKDIADLLKMIEEDIAAIDCKAIAICGQPVIQEYLAEIKKIQEQIDRKAVVYLAKAIEEYKDVPEFVAASNKFLDEIKATGIPFTSPAPFLYWRQENLPDLEKVYKRMTNTKRHPQKI